MSKRGEGVTGQAVLLQSTCSDYELIWSDKGSHAKKDVTIFRPKPPKGWYILGDYAQGSYAASAQGAALVVSEVKSTDPTEPDLIVPPVKAVLVWSYVSKSMYILQPVAPAGYYSIGCIASTSAAVTAKQLENYACIHHTAVVPTRAGVLIWNDKSAHTSDDVSLYSIVDISNVFVAQSNYLDYSNTVYRPAV